MFSRLITFPGCGWRRLGVPPQTKPGRSDDPTRVGDGERAVGIFSDLHALAAKIPNVLLPVHGPAWVFGRRFACRRANREARPLEVAPELAPAVAFLVAALDVRRRAIAPTEFGLEVLPFIRMQLTRRSVGIDVDVWIELCARHRVRPSEEHSFAQLVGGNRASIQVGERSPFPTARRNGFRAASWPPCFIHAACGRPPAFAEASAGWPAGAWATAGTKGASRPGQPPWSSSTWPSSPRPKLNMSNRSPIAGLLRGM